MPSPRLLAVVTALILAAGAPAAHATYTLTNLQALEQMVLDQDWRGLHAFIEANPELLHGNDPLAIELRNYVATYRESVIGRFFNPPQAPGQELIEQLVAQY